MRKFDFFEVVKVVEHPAARELGVVGATGTVLGISKTDSALSYAVSIDELSYSLPESALESTGSFADRSDFYRGESIEVDLYGDVVGTKSASASDPGQRAFADFEVVTVENHPDAAGLGLVGATGVVMGDRGGPAGRGYVVMIGDESGSSPESYVLPEPALRSTGRRLSRDDVYSGRPIRLDADGDRVLHPPW